MSLSRARISLAIALATACLVGPLASCGGILSPKRTPERAVIHFLKAVGRGDLDGAREWVAPESAGMIEEWSRLLFFPSHATPINPEEEGKIDQFIALFYRITVMEKTETEARVSLVFVATDALVGFPSVADDPLVPNSAPFMLNLERGAEDAEEGSWRIVMLEPGA